MWAQGARPGHERPPAVGPWKYKRSVRCSLDPKTPARADASLYNNYSPFIFF
jgi:hypothetical protein